MRYSAIPRFLSTTFVTSASSTARLRAPRISLGFGVETTTGPLGQGVATSVGMGIAEKWLANRYNRPGFEIFDYNIYTVCGDGCMMEGVASEAASLAGHLGLDNLCWIYDNNHITIEGRRGSLLQRTSRRDSWPMAGTSYASVMPTISSVSNMPSTSSERPRSVLRS